MAAQRYPITVAQYEHSFEGHPDLRDELINGRIVMTPKPKPLNQHIRQNIDRLLDAACKGTEYIVNGGSNIKFPSSNSAPAPNVFVVATSKWQDAMRTGTYLDAPPLMAIEILSSSQLGMNEKVDIYIEAGVSVLWVVDPKKRTVILYAGHRQHLYQEHDEMDLPLPLKGSIKVVEIFAGLPKPLFDDE